jgi:rod shape-determining protein MreC
MSKRPYLIATAAVALLALICFTLSPEGSAQAKRVFGSFYSPLFSAQKTAQTTGKYLTNQTTPREALLRENRELKRQNDILELKLEQLYTLSHENHSLRQQLKMQPKHEWNPRLTRIIGRDPSNWWRSIQIDLGSVDGVRTDMPVMANGGLIGRVQEVYLHRSRVALLGDPICRISATIEETGESGILSSTGGTVFDPTLAELLYLPTGTKARVGDKIYTSGFGEVFPRGIHIGKILAVENTSGKLTTKASVKLAINPSLINEVWVLMP